ncbi:hypothetical protein B0H10DRAFT_1953221 [Mycena sp. CBHHK59/15]|nr:hypothetical protein B0H10DRAFT_1953221 [Mycena sp. CBHHK59/15]
MANKCPERVETCRTIGNQVPVWCQSNRGGILSMNLNQRRINVINASAELKKAVKLLKGYIKKNSVERERLEAATPGGYKKALEERIVRCKLLIAQFQLEQPSEGCGDMGPGTGNVGSGMAQSKAMIYLMVSITMEAPGNHHRVRGLNLGVEKTVFNQCLVQNVIKQG